MYWPSLLPQASAAPYLAVPVDVHGALAIGGFLLLFAAMTLGLGVLGLAMRD